MANEPTGKTVVGRVARPRMANEPTGKTVVGRVARPRARISTTNMKSAYCNFFTARVNPEDVVLNFGFDERGGSAQKDPQQVQILHKVILSVATARRVKDTLVALFQKRDAPRVRVKAQVVPPRILN